MERLQLRTGLLTMSARSWPLKLSAVLLVLLACFTPTDAGAQLHNYPLIGWQSFGGAIEEFYARFDLIVIRPPRLEFAQKIKQINPNILLVPTMDWNTGGEIRDIPREWILKKSNGSNLNVYTGGDPNNGWPMLNFSDLCPRASSGPYAGKTYAEYLPIHITEYIDLNFYDGTATDGAWGDTEMRWLYNHSEFADVDLDNNGVNDHSEHNVDWFTSHWRNGMDTIMKGLRQRAGSKLIVINSGNAHTWNWAEQNGIIVEKGHGWNDKTFGRDYFNRFRAQSAKPFVAIYDGLPAGSYPGTNNDDNSKNHFGDVRFGVVTSMFNDLYYSFQDLNAQEHYWSYWYDEFETDLGKPTSAPVEISPGVYARFFDKGAAIASVDGSTHTATDADLKKVAQYSGPYYRFRGGQAPDFNDGSVFSNVELRGRILDGWQHVGDGIILLKQPVTVVSDHIIDNSDSGTSPGSVAAALSGGFEQEQDCRAEGNAYTVRCSGWLNTFKYAKASPGAGEAAFVPTVGVAGTYEVFEWHATVPGGASNVTYTIVHAGGQKEVRVDQSQREGGWNSLGTYTFNQGRNGKVVISASGANGTVIADAVKFVYRDGGQVDTTPPAPPKGVRVSP